jgi:hypothetical protein
MKIRYHTWILRLKRCSVAEPYAILAVPVSGDPGGLLAWDAAGCVMRRDGLTTDAARPPVVTLPDGRRCLPVWLDGALVPEGWDRLRRAVCGQDASQLSLFPFAPSQREVLLAAGIAARVFSMGRVVVLDFVDGLPRERAS